MALTLAGIIYGSLYAILVLSDIRDTRLQNMKMVVEMATREELRQAEKWLVKAERTQETMDQHRSVHSHLTLLGLLGMILSLFTDNITFNFNFMKAVAYLYVLGSFIMPLGIFLETTGYQVIGFYTAVLGSIWVLLTTAVIAAGTALSSLNKPKT
ncbi:hypothetical protein [Calderihabitans maritimus]|uniref:Uncharacterized protein n=1 Tax=Calderihabitans maritimus TaxID=1246530 RepID=A0A1Z5HPJ1_9FIRM|nr:hypothetical protein [Calderihabitans maritimus]GAW91215.1 hypothetical protein KKC1_03770 [Calderihabitans maritimus]